MQRLLSRIRRIGLSSIPVLLIGETGCGKEVVAEWVHACSRRAARPLVRVNCAGLTESVVESELFGHERGAFTGATHCHRGLFEAADGGTLLLDELAELPLRTQAKLLRVLETGELTRLGSTQSRRVSVRFVAATHRPLSQLMERGEFRTDLYYRLCGARLEIPPLRERPAEILPLARHFLSRLAAAEGGAPARLDAGAERALSSYPWPGNVRELRNVVECAAASSGDGVIREDLLSVQWVRTVSPPRPAPRLALVDPVAEPRAPALDGPSPDAAEPVASLRESLRDFEGRCIRAALNRCHGNQTAAARRLGISRRALTNKLARHGIDRPRGSSRRPPPGAASWRDERSRTER